MTEQNSQTVITSGRGKLSARDLIQGALAAGLGAVLSIASPLLEGGNLDIDFDRMWKLALGVGIVHIARKLLHPPVVVITKPTEKAVEAVKSGEATVEITTPESINPVMTANSGNQKSSI
jgi:hypothetical protein